MSKNPDYDTPHLRPHKSYCTGVIQRLVWVLFNTPLQIWIQSIINRWYFECTSIWTSIIKQLWKVKKMVMVKLKLQRYFVIYKRSPLKMQKIKKPRSPSRQLLETVNFAFMKIFDFLVKIALFRASLLFLGDSHHAFPPGSLVRLWP